MKDFGYYKNIIYQNYNPERKKLTKEKFYSLRNKIIDGKKEYADELCELMCFHVYDILAHAYAEKIFKVEFEDALQIAAFKLYRMKIGDEKTKFKTNYFTEITLGTSLKKLEYEIMSRIFKELEDLEAQAETLQIPMSNASHKINSLLQNPEELAITHLVRNDLKNFVTASGVGRSEELRKASGEQTWSWLAGESTFQEMADQERSDNQHGNRQTIHNRCKDTLSSIAMHKNENGIKDLLL